MFAVDEATTEAIRRAFDEGGELAAAIELRRHFPLLNDNAHARQCVRAILTWKPITPIRPRGRRAKGAQSRSGR